MLDFGDGSFAFRRQGCTDEGGASAQIRGRHLRSRKPVDPFDDCHSPGYLHVGSHAQQLVDVAETALVNALCDDGSPVCRRQHRSEWLMHVSGKPGMWRSFDVDSFWPAITGNAKTV